MKTLILFSSSEIGGAERSLSRLSEKGKRNEFILGSLSGDGSIFQTKAKIKTPILKFGYQKTSLGNLIFSCVKAFVFSRKNKIDILYICGFKACTIIRIISVFFKTPKIIHAIRWNPISNNRDDKIFRYLEKFFNFNTSGWICNSKSASDTLINYCGIPKEKVTYIYNGIETKKKNFNNSFNKHKFILTLSNFSPRKGLIDYLNVIEKVLKKNKNVEFILAGRDNMNGLVQKTIKQKKLEKFVHTPGFIYNTPEVFKKSYMVVLPSLLPEGCPTSILEAMSYGKPIIGYNIYGINELVIDDINGFLISINDQEAMAARILKLIDSPDLVEKLGIRGYSRVLKEFSLNKMLDEHRNYINNL